MGRGLFRCQAAAIADASHKHTHDKRCQSLKQILRVFCRWFSGSIIQRPPLALCTSFGWLSAVVCTWLGLDSPFPRSQLFQPSPKSKIIMFCLAYQLLPPSSLSIKYVSILFYLSIYLGRRLREFDLSGHYVRASRLQEK
jgi:hypothetical protein